MITLIVRQGPCSGTGIVVAGTAVVGGLLHGYILADLTIKGTPDQWATAAVTGYYRTGADRIIGEVNGTRPRCSFYY